MQIPRADRSAGPLAAVLSPGPGTVRQSTMLLIGIGWLYVVLMVALVELTSADGSWLGALGTLLFWGLLPLGIGGYLLLAPARRRRRREAESRASAPLDPDRGGHPAGDAVAPVREEA